MNKWLGGFVIVAEIALLFMGAHPAIAAIGIAVGVYLLIQD